MFDKPAWIGGSPEASLKCSVFEAEGLSLQASEF